MNSFLHTAKQEALKAILKDYPGTNIDALSRAFEAGVHAESDLQFRNRITAMEAARSRQRMHRENVVVPFGQTDAMIASMTAGATK
jgi:hypothetical protein